MRDYQKLARYLDKLKAEPDARVSYDLFAGALVWSDELPAPGSYCREEFSAAELRGIWNYRSSLILSNPKDKFRAAWEAAQQCFPHWPGFDPKRRDVCWAETLKTLESKAMKEWTELEGRFVQSKATEPQKAVV
jgi:hypothetical protein